MRFARVQKGDASLSDLVSRLYDIRGPKSKERAEEAEAALLRANPNLKEGKGLAEGAVVIVPDVAAVKSSAEFQPLESFMGDMLAQVSKAIGGMRARLEASDDRRAEEAKQALEILKDSKVKAQATKDPAIKKAVASITKESQARVKDAKALSTFHADAISRLEKDIDGLASRITERETENNEYGKNSEA